MADMELSTTSKVEANVVKEVGSGDIEYSGSGRCRPPEGLGSQQTLDVGFIESDATLEGKGKDSKKNRG
jgi:hypothetical protein